MKQCLPEEEVMVLSIREWKKPLPARRRGDDVARRHRGANDASRYMVGEIGARSVTFFAKIGYGGHMFNSW